MYCDLWPQSKSVKNNFQLWPLTYAKNLSWPLTVFHLFHLFSLYFHELLIHVALNIYQKRLTIALHFETALSIVPVVDDLYSTPCKCIALYGSHSNAWLGLSQYQICRGKANNGTLHKPNLHTSNIKPPYLCRQCLDIQWLTPVDTSAFPYREVPCVFLMTPRYWTYDRWALIRI